MDIKNIAVLSNNMFFNSRHLREVKGRYQYLKRKLKQSGISSAKRKFGGRKRRFVRDFNYIISRRIISLPYDMIAFEALNPTQMMQNEQGRKFRKMFGS
ncbi:MAG: hypothetical protein ACP5L4_05715 [Thermoplasmata archaeon]